MNTQLNEQARALEPIAPSVSAKPSAGAPPWIRTALAVIRTVLWWGVTGTVAYFAAGQAFFLESHPFGIGLLCAINGSAVVPVLLGCVLSAQNTPQTALLYTAVYVGVFLLRTAADIVFYKGKFPPPRAFFRESVGTKTALACFAALAVSTYELIVNGYLYYDVFRMAFFAVVCAVFTCYLAGGFRSTLFLGRVTCATAAATVFLLEVLLRTVRVGGVHLGLILGLMAVLYTARNFGAAHSAALGVLLALPMEAALSAQGVSAVAVMGVVGLSAGAFFALSPYLALAAAAVTGLGVCVVFGGFSGLLSMLPELISTTVLMYPLLKYDILPARERVGSTSAEPIRLSQIKHTEEKLEMLSKTFTTIAELATGLARKARRDPVGGGDACVIACEKLCQNCTSYKTCWGENRKDTVSAIGEMTELLRARGTIDEREVPKALTARCSELNRVVTQLEQSYAALERSAPAWGSTKRQEALALNYTAISRLFRRVLYEEKDAFTSDEALSAKVRYGVKKACFPADAVYVYGKRKKYIVAEDVEVAGLELGCDDVRKLFENISGLRLTSPEFSIDGRRISMSMHTRRQFKTESSYQTSMISGGSVNGDTVSTFYGHDDRFYALISDGMGSGQDAAATSGICSIFLEQLLAGGNDRETALELLNDFIRSRQAECSATVDLAEVDLITGEACFSKSGAAPTFIKRGEDIFKLQAKTIPVGIVSSADAEHIRFTLKTGDVIIMISDGVAAGFEESGWLLRMIDEEWTADLDEMGKRILEGAKANNLRTDDMSVCLVRVV